MKQCKPLSVVRIEMTKDQASILRQVAIGNFQKIFRKQNKHKNLFY